MTAVDLNLREFTGRDQVDEQWAGPWALQVYSSLTQPGVTRSHDRWLTAIEDRRDDLDQRLQRGEMDNYHTAAGAWFVLDLLQAADVEVDGGCGCSLLGFVLQIAFTDEEWQEIFVKVFNRLSTSDVTKSMTLDSFYIVRNVLFQRGRLDVLGELYGLVRGRIHSLREDCINRSTSYQQWLYALARVAVALRERHFVPITDADGWFPIAEQLFSPDQLIELRRDEAFFAEQIAHLGTAIIKPYVYPDYIDNTRDYSYNMKNYLDNMRRKFMTVNADSRLDARQELRLMKSRFEVPSYLFKELDNYLRLA